jgi:hypothetical protein
LYYNYISQPFFQSVQHFYEKRKDPDADLGAQKHPDPTDPDAILNSAQKSKKGDTSKGEDNQSPHTKKIGYKSKFIPSSKVITFLLTFRKREQ